MEPARDCSTHKIPRGSVGAGPDDHLAAGVKTERFTMPFRGRVIPTSRWSDHSPFWDRGYAAAMLTDTAWLRSPHYHRPTDRKETLDLAFMAGIAAGLCRFFHEPPL